MVWLEPALELLVLLELELGLELGRALEPEPELELVASDSSASAVVFGTAPCVVSPVGSKLVGSSYVAFVDYCQDCRYSAVAEGVVLPFDEPCDVADVPSVVHPSFRSSVPWNCS